MSRNAHPEAGFQQAVCKYFELIRLDRRAMWFSVEVSVEAGGHKVMLKQKRLKARGVKAGTPDIVILPPGQPGIQVELKTKEGRLSPAQQQWQKESILLDEVPYYVARSIEDIQAILKRHGLLGRRRLK